MKVKQARPFTVVTVRMPEDLYQWVASLADAEERSLNGQIITMLRRVKTAEARRA